MRGKKERAYRFRNEECATEKSDLKMMCEYSRSHSKQRWDSTTMFGSTKTAIDKKEKVLSYDEIKVEQ